MQLTNDLGLGSGGERVDIEGRYEIRGLPEGRWTVNAYGRSEDRSWQATGIRLEEDTLTYFRQLAVDTGLPYQTLIHLDLRDGAESRRKLGWSGQGPGRRRRQPRTRTG